ncbi:TBC1 domain family member 4 isoform X1 [Arapaima gigas]
MNARDTLLREYGVEAAVIHTARPQLLDEMEVRRAQDGAQSGSHEKNFRLCYLGSSPLDQRTTLPMLPWLVAEIRRRGERGDAREVQLRLTPPLLRCVPADSGGSGGSVFIFEHHAHAISRFVHNSHDVRCFAYLIRSRPDDPESEMACHVFRALEPGQNSSCTAKFDPVSLPPPLCQGVPTQSVQTINISAALLPI